MSSSSYKITFSAFDRANQRNLYFKADGKRFRSDRTLKVCCDVKYDFTVTVSPSDLALRKVVIGGDENTPESSSKKDDGTEYTFPWFTNGYSSTGSGRRSDLHFTFIFDSLEIATDFQVKFYPIDGAAHLTWGTVIQRIELECRGKPHTGGGASPFQNLAPTSITFK